MTKRHSVSFNRFFGAALVAVLIAAVLPTAAQAGFTIPVTEYSVLATTWRPWMITDGPDGNMWFTSYTTPNGFVSKITPAGVITTYTVAPGAYDIAAGPDEGGEHYMWFTESTYDTISKINTATGAITQYDVADGSEPMGITRGPDGAMWFTYANKDKIGRLTTSGNYSEFDVSVTFSGISDIILGPDGNLWFTEHYDHNIGKINPISGIVTEYSLPGVPEETGNPYVITVGPDGNLWFTIMNDDMGVGRITTAGVVTLFPISSRPIAITSGTDGNLWITESRTHTIGRLTTAGILTHYDVPTANTDLWGIGTGSDGNIWFVESDNDKIGKLVPQSSFPSVGQISLSSIMYPGPTSFTVSFNQDVADPSGNTAPEDVTNPNNYLLVNLGANGYLNTASCAGGLVADDVKISINSVSYDSPSHTATIAINGGVALPNNNYALFVCGTTSITNLVGNPLGGGSDFLSRFTVSPSSTYLPATGFAPGVNTVLAPQPAHKAYSILADLWLEIPALDVKQPIIGVPAARDGWDVTWLGDQAGWLEGTAFPTWSGNSVITGHVWNADNTPGIFIDLEKLAWGDEIIVHAWGQSYTYEVRSTRKFVQPTDTRVITHEEFPWLTLVTCKEFDDQTDAYRWRVVVRAVQVRVK